MWLVAALAATGYCLLNLNSLRTYHTGGDFGLFMQSMNDPSGLLRNAIEGSHFSDHFSPIYDLFAPLIQLTHSALPIVLIQAIAGGLTAVGLYEIAVLRIAPRVALAAASAALIYPPLVSLMFGDPYETCFAPAATIWLCYCVLRRRWIWACVLALLTLAIKEDQALFLGWDAIVLFVWAMRVNDLPLRRFSVALLATAACIFVAFVAWIQPAAAAHTGWAALHTTQIDYGGEHLGLGLSLMRRLGYFAEVFLPLVLVPFLAPRALIFAVAPLAEVLVPQYPLVWTMSAHYTGAWIGYVLIAWIFGIVQLQAARPTACGRVVAVVLALCALDLTFASPTHWRATVHAHDAHDARLDEIVANDLPSTGTIGMAEGFFGHLWQSDRYQTGLTRLPCYALIDTTEKNSAFQNGMSRDIIDRTYGTYLPQWTKDGVVLYRRQGCH